ncbi:carbamoyltransferase HypF [bacterium]|nr:carbamoyltransferase HypF [bacterium]
MDRLAGTAGYRLQGDLQIDEQIGARIHINGIVQGVGFRPFVFNLAESYGLKGWVRNTSAGVDIEVDGTPEQLAGFEEDLQALAPPLSKIDEFSTLRIAAQGFDTFSITHSENDPNAFVPISPDVTICDDCLEELYDPADRRYRYPFINCTNCGPRFTIIKDIPYDRPYTTMADFPMCPDCREEYENPRDRRFHAQPVACPECGPHIWLSYDGETASGLNEEDALQKTRGLLTEGKILAIRGLGGFHLACDATNPGAVATLRKRKFRVGKPFAVMFPSVEAIEKHCDVTKAERELITSRERPIVIVHKKPESTIDSEVTPGQKTLGVMLPYTPLHALLLEEAPGFPDALVMTSGNLSDEPIATENLEAKTRLQTLADAFLLHNRDIYIRCDDSVVRAVNHPTKGESIYLMRRSRGYAPNPIRTKWDMPQILAGGPALKNTFCLTKGTYAFLSHHIGDLDNFETLTAYQEGIAHFERLFRISPEHLAYDLHPDYLSTRYIIQRAGEENLPALGIQHHHAHIAACMAENDLPPDEPVIGISFDGTGYGTDGTIWGGEILLSSYTQFERSFHLQAVPLPGGDAATKEPWRFALSMLQHAGIPWEEDLPPVQFTPAEMLPILEQQIKKRINAPLTSSMGRLFDAAAAIAGVREAVSYEAQAAIEFEAMVNPVEDGQYDYEIVNRAIDPSILIQQMVSDVRQNLPLPNIAAKFHHTIARMSLDTSRALREQHNIHRVALSGGVWQNMVLLEETISLLKKDNFEVFIHSKVPANDGGLSLGQAVIAYHSITR